MEKLYKDFLKYFSVEEIVSDELFSQHGHKGSNFILSHFDPRLLEVMVWVRTTLDLPITINNWKWGGSFSQRGLRDNLQELVERQTGRGRVYLSGHVLGMAFDFDVKGMTAYGVRDWLLKHSEDCPHYIRLENKLNGKQISWVHLDVKYDPKNPKVYLFNI